MLTPNDLGLDADMGRGKHMGVDVDSLRLGFGSAFLSWHVGIMPRLILRVKNLTRMFLEKMVDGFFIENHQPDWLFGILAS